MTLRAPGLPRGTVGGPHVSALKAVDAGGRVGLPAPGHILSSARGRQGVLRVQVSLARGASPSEPAMGGRVVGSWPPGLPARWGVGPSPTPAPSARLSGPRTLSGTVRTVPPAAPIPVGAGGQRCPRLALVLAQRSLLAQDQGAFCGLSSGSSPACCPLKELPWLSSLLGVLWACRFKV